MSLYAVIIRGGIISNLNLTYSELIKDDIKNILDMSPIQYHALGVEITEFRCVLIVSIEAVCVVKSPS